MSSALPPSSLVNRVVLFLSFYLVGNVNKILYLFARSYYREYGIDFLLGTVKVKYKDNNTIYYFNFKLNSPKLCVINHYDKKRVERNFGHAKHYA